MDKQQPPPSQSALPSTPTMARTGLPGGALAALYVLVALAPLSLAAATASGTGHVSFELGAASALVAAALMTLQFLSSGRFEALSGRIGIDRTMGFHRIAAYVLLVLAVLHPLSYVGADAFEQPAAAWMRLQGMLSSPRLRSGAIALALLVVLVAFATVRTRPFVRYELWRASHGLVALAAFGLTLHHGINVGHYSAQPIMRLTWIVYALAAVSAAAIVYFVRPWRMWREVWRVESARDIAAGVTHLVLRGPADTQLRFRGGQFVWATLAPHRPPFHDHPFSIASGPDELPALRFIIGHAGDCTRTLARLPPGTRAAIDGPHGSFVLPDTSDPILMIAGGIGIAPLLGMLNEAAAGGDSRPFRLLYAARSEAALVGLAELDALRKRLDLTVLTAVDDAPPSGPVLKGPLGREHIEKAIGGWNPAVLSAMLCGPPSMMEVAADTLLELGVPANQIHFERFDYGSGKGRIDRYRRRVALALLGVFPLAVVAFAFR